MKLFKNLSGFTLVEMMKKFSLILLISFFFDSSSAPAQTLKNPALNNCVSAPAFVPTANNKRPINDYDCVPTPVDSKGNLSIAADRDYTQWKDTLLTGADNKQMTGFYTKKGARCETATQATTDCPIAVKAKYVFDCGDVNDTVNFHNGKCAQAKTIKVYHATYQAVTIPGEAPIRPTIVGDKSVYERAIDATPIATATISTSIGKGKYECKDLQVAGGPPLFQKGEDAYGNPICLPDTTVEIMRETICKQMMQLLWNNGRSTSSSTDPCAIITITKSFKLNNTGKTDKTTNDCIANGGRVFNGTTDVTNNLQSYPGGTISGAINSESDYFAKYGQQSPSPTFRCKLKSVTSASKSFTSGSNVLSPTDGTEFVPGSLVVDFLYGGGGGGGGSTDMVGGFGGHGSAKVSGALSSVTNLATCTVTIGVGGNPATGKCEGATKGVDSTVNCSGGNLTSIGGAGGSACSGSCNGTNGGSSYGSGGEKGHHHTETRYPLGIKTTYTWDECGVGKTGGYGAGGGGGSVCNDLAVISCSQKDGGAGGSGIAQVTWKEAKYVDW